MQISVSDFTHAAKATLYEATAAGLAGAAQAATDEATRRINVPWPPPSKPGEAPHRRRRGHVEPLAVSNGLTKEPSAGISLTPRNNILAWWETNGRPWILPSIADTPDEQVEAFKKFAAEVLED